MIYVLGSINNDIAVELERRPKRGETIPADGCRMGLGGKGANQAVAIAKLTKREEGGGKPAVKLIGRVGEDAIGGALISKLNEYGVDTQFVRRTHRATGTAITTITAKDSRMVVYGGANSGISKTDVDEALEGATSGDTLLVQLEIPLYVALYALRKARSMGMTTILNPSPAVELPDDAFFNVDIIVPNAVETQKITGINPSDFTAQKNAMRWFHSRGVQYVVLTLGSNGCSLSDGAYIVSHVPPRKVDVVDTTGAGDTFVGALALTYPHIGMYSFEEACAFANKAASLTVSRPGAAESIPTMPEVCRLYIKEIPE